MYCHHKNNPAQTTNRQAIAIAGFQRIFITALDCFWEGCGNRGESTMPGQMAKPGVYTHRASARSGLGVGVLVANRTMGRTVGGPRNRSGVYFQLPANPKRKTQSSARRT